MSAVTPDALDVAAAAGIHGITVPTPFSVGSVNAYLIEGSPLTLVDCGPDSATSLASLERDLAARGHRVEDLERLVITHQHTDHFGLTALLAERSGAEVVCLDILVDYVEQYAEQSVANDAYTRALLLRHGIDRKIMDALSSVRSIVRSFAGPVPISRALSEGEILLAGDRALRVLHRPGHSPSDTVFHDEAAGILIAGDHLLSKISSNALLTRPLGDPAADGARPMPLVEYRRSLEATAAMDLQLVLGGHGHPIVDHRALIGRRLDRQLKRADEIHALLKDRPQSAHELAAVMWGAIAFTQPHLTISEVLGHIDLAIADGRVAEDATGDVVRFEAR
jgi:glyoxylase-like metal-dependent hydrolase (beta-lactamase superfamily II)